MLVENDKVSYPCNLDRPNNVQLHVLSWINTVIALINNKYEIRKQQVKQGDDIELSKKTIYQANPFTKQSQRMSIKNRILMKKQDIDELWNEEGRSICNEISSRSWRH